MTEPLKSAGPLLGYNNNIPYKGHVYHVQTEDSGARRPHVITHLFADGGRIVKTTKTSYAEFVDSENASERVRSLMRDQHKRMVIALRDGQLDHLLLEGAGPEVEELPLGAPPPAPSGDGVGETIEPASIPIELVERAASVDDDDFVLEVQELVPPKASSEPSPGSYSYVGRRSAGSTRPPSASEPPPPTPRRGSQGTPPTGSKVGGARRRPQMDSVAFEDRPTTPFSLGELQGGFGHRYISDRRFDEVVLAFLRREGIVGN